MDALEVRSADDGGQDNQDTPDELAEIRSAVQGLTTTAEQRLGAVDTALTELRGRLDRTETALRRPGAAGGTPQRPAGELEQRAFANFLRRGRELLPAEEQRILRVSDDTAGGYLAPDQFIAVIDREIVNISPVRRIARVTPVSAAAVLLPKRLTGFTARYVGEIEPRPETTATFGQSRFEVREAAAWVDVSNQLLEDAAVDVAAEVAFEFAEEFGRLEGQKFVNGNGVLEPTGFLTDTTIPSIPSGAAATLPVTNPADLFFTLLFALPPAYRANATWVMNATTLATVATLKNAGGDYLLMREGIANAPVMTLLGRPVVEAPDMPNIGAGAVPIVVGDFRQGYRIFDRVALSVLRDPYSQATNGITRFHGRRRHAAGVARPQALLKLRIAAS